jgi:hypothetical protein
MHALFDILSPTLCKYHKSDKKKDGNAVIVHEIILLSLKA